MTTIVLMQFGDGTNHKIEVEADDPAEAVKEAREWVQDNAWFEVQDDDSGETLAETRLA